MGLKKLGARLADYRARLDAGKASKIEPEHVSTVLSKLRKKEADLIERIANASCASEQERLQRKLEIAREQIERADWLLVQLETEPRQ